VRVYQGACKITRVQKDSDTIVVSDVRYWNFHSYVAILNSGGSDVADVELVVNLKVNHATVASDTKTIGTVKARVGSTRINCCRFTQSVTVISLTHKEIIKAQ